MAWTKSDGWVCVFVLVDYHSDEAWCHVAKSETLRTDDAARVAEPEWNGVGRALHSDLERAVPLC